MKKLILIFLALIFFSGIVSGAKFYNGDRSYFDCHNASSGELLGSSATLTCRDSVGNADINGQALTNVETGIFYYTFSLDQDTYGCQLDCPTGAMDYIVPVLIESVLATNSNVTDILTEFTTVTNNQDSLDTYIKEVNTTTQNTYNEVIDGTYGLSALLTAVQAIDISGVWNQTVNSTYPGNQDGAGYILWALERFR